MTKTLVIFGSTSGNTETVAEKIGQALGECEIKNITSCSVEDLAAYDSIIIGSSTWGMGSLQDDWEESLSMLSSVDLTGKNVALYGTGDQSSFPNTFVDAIGILYDALQKSGAKFIGSWPVESYDYLESKAERDGCFVGLPIDENTQPELTEERVKNWVDQLKKEMGQ